MRMVSLFGYVDAEKAERTYLIDESGYQKPYEVQSVHDCLDESLYGHWAILYDVYKTSEAERLSWSEQGRTFNFVKRNLEKSDCSNKSSEDEYNEQLSFELDQTSRELLCAPKKMGNGDVEKAFSDQLFNRKELKICIDVIKKTCPKYYLTALEYLKGHELIEDTAFVLSKEFFDDLCGFVFPLLFEQEKKTDTNKLPLQKLNFLEVLGTFLFGVFIQYNRSTQKQKFLYYPLSLNRVIQPAKTNFAPVFSENAVTVVLSSSDFFSPYLGVCIKSIIRNATVSNNYDIIVFERGISQENKNKILKLTDNRENISIRFFNVAQNTSCLKFFINSTRISQETYYGLLIPWFLPQYGKAIIMDCDMIVKQDLAELYHESLGNFVAGGVRDIILQGWLNDSNNDTAKYYFDDLNAKNPFSFVNGGLILLDFVKYREIISQELVLHYINNYQFRVVDQDIFNLLLEDKIKPLNQKWNHMIYVEGAISAAIANAPHKSQEEYFSAKKFPGIIHYASENKPWRNPDLEFAEEFWEVARSTPFYETILIRMLQGYLPQCTVPDTSVVIDQRSGARRIADVLFPVGSKKRKLLKVILPKGSLRWRFCKQIYYIFRPEYRPVKVVRGS